MAKTDNTHMNTYEIYVNKIFLNNNDTKIVQLSSQLVTGQCKENIRIQENIYVFYIIMEDLLGMYLCEILLHNPGYVFAV